jgi:hypothetical protein
MITRVSIAMAVIIVLTANAVHAQGTDPYAEGQSAYAKERINKEVDDLLSLARRASNAAACNVVLNGEAMYVVNRELAEVIERSATRYHIPVDFRTLQQQIKDARLAGLTEAGLTGDDTVNINQLTLPMGTKCAFWKDHPDAVRAMRDFVGR